MNGRDSTADDIRAAELLVRITELEAERDRLLAWQHAVADALGVSEPAGPGYPWHCEEDPSDAAEHARIAAQAWVDLAEAQDDLHAARELIDWFADDEPCDLDDHGGCQAHSHFEPDPGEECPNAIALRWLAAHPTEGEQQ